VRVDVRRALEPVMETMSRAEASMPNTVAHKLDPHQLWASLEADPAWHDWQEGRMTPRQWHEHLTRRLGVAIDFAEFRGAWNGALDPVTILDDDLFAALGTRCRLALLSNTDPLHAEYLDRHFSFGRYFSARIYSCAVGLSKPSPAIYKAALDALGVAPADALYIDDIPEYAAAARELGIDAIRFEDSPQLIRELKARGLPTCRSPGSRLPGAS